MVPLIGVIDDKNHDKMSVSLNEQIYGTHNVSTCYCTLYSIY